MRHTIRALSNGFSNIPHRQIAPSIASRSSGSLKPPIILPTASGLLKRSECLLLAAFYRTRDARPDLSRRYRTRRSTPCLRPRLRVTSARPFARCERCLLRSSPVLIMNPTKRGGLQLRIFVRHKVAPVRHGANRTELNFFAMLGQANSVSATDLGDEVDVRFSRALLCDSRSPFGPNTLVGKQQCSGFQRDNSFSASRTSCASPIGSAQSSTGIWRPPTGRPFLLDFETASDRGAMSSKLSLRLVSAHRFIN